jgi:glutamate-1-semialdehyde aminotransferase
MYKRVVAECLAMSDAIIQRTTIVYARRCHSRRGSIEIIDSTATSRGSSIKCMIYLAEIKVDLTIFCDLIGGSLYLANLV